MAVFAAVQYDGMAEHEQCIANLSWLHRKSRGRECILSAICVQHATRMYEKQSGKCQDAVVPLNDVHYKANGIFKIQCQENVSIQIWVLSSHHNGSDFQESK